MNNDPNNSIYQGLGDGGSGDTNYAVNCAYSVNCACATNPALAVFAAEQVDGEGAGDDDHGVYDTLAVSAITEDISHHWMLSAFGVIAMVAIVVVGYQMYQKRKTQG